MLPPLSEKLAGRVAVVTGGGGTGLGAAAAKMLAAHGAKVGVVDVDPEQANLTVDAIEQTGGVARALIGDVATARSVEESVRTVLDEWRRIDILVANCGIRRFGTVVTCSEEDWDAVFRVNVKGTFLWARAVIPHMTTLGSGSIITVSSQLAFNNDGNCAAYTATKGALVSLTRAMAVDHGPAGIRVNCLVPGVIDTPASRQSLLRKFPDDPEGAQAKRRARHALNRLGKPDEVAKAVLFLASDDSTFTTGQTLFVDGGWTIK